MQMISKETGMEDYSVEERLKHLEFMIDKLLEEGIQMEKQLKELKKKTTGDFQMSLSDKMIDLGYPDSNPYVYIERDVKKFIQKLKEDLTKALVNNYTSYYLKDRIDGVIDKLAGKRLCE